MFIFFFYFSIHLSSSWGRNTNKSIEKLPEHLLAKPHPSNLNLSSVYILHFNPSYAAGLMSFSVEIVE